MGAVIEHDRAGLPAEIRKLKDAKGAVDDLELLTARYARVGDTDKAEECAYEYSKRVEELVADYKRLVRLRGRQPSKKSGAEFLKDAAGNDLNNAAPHSLSRQLVEKHTGIQQPQISKWEKKLQKPEEFRQSIVESAYRKWMGKRGQTDQRGASGTGENEWFTPPAYLDLARQVLGEFELDPASSAQAQKTVRATKYFTPKQDGLKQEWHGRVWLNPPYAQPLIAQFAEKMASEYEARRVNAAIVLTHNYTDTAWFQRLARASSAICFTKGRVKFYDKNGKEAAPTQGQAFFYFGPGIARFREIFDEPATGFVLTRT